MKKFLMMLLTLAMLLSVALAENTKDAIIVLPTEVMEQTDGLLTMSDAIAKAKESMAIVPAESLTRAELVRLSDNSPQWIVTIFDISTFYADGWCMTVHAETGAVTRTVTTNMGYFAQIYDEWTAVKGPQSLWSLSDKQLYDRLYTVSPSYGQPVAGDMSYGDALAKAIDALELKNVVDYQIGYGYLMGSGDGVTNGVWEVFFVQNGETVYKVNLDAVTGDIYYIEPDAEGNG